MEADAPLVVVTDEEATLGVREVLTVGVANPGMVWLPVVASSTVPGGATARVVARSAGEVTGPAAVDLGPTRSRRSRPPAMAVGPRPLRRPPRDVLRAAPPDLGRLQAYSFVPANLVGRDTSLEATSTIAVQAMIEGADGARSLEAQTRVVVSALPEPRGWHAGDAHVHTTMSDGWMTPEQTAWYAKNVSGVSWLVCTDHADDIRDWHAYVDECGRVSGSQGLLVCAGAEFSARMAGPDGHALGHSLPTDDLSSLPPSPSPPQTLFDSIDERGGFATIAHPDNAFYAWKDWTVTGFRSMELATGRGSEAKTDTLARWFGQLQDALGSWKDRDAPPPFVVGIATGDSHELVISAMPGERHVVWVNTGRDESPSDAATLFFHLRQGHCVASCGGDFGTLSVNGAGPGSVCAADPDSLLQCEFTWAPRQGNHLAGIQLFDADGTLQGGWVPGAANASTEQVRPPVDKGLLVARFVFVGPRGRAWEVWTNPVWVRVA